MDLLLEPALDPRRGDSLDALECLLEAAIGEPATLGEIAGSAEGDAENRIEGRIEAQDDGIFGLLRKDEPVELLPDIEKQEIHVGAPVELEGDLGDAGAGDRVDGAQTAQHPHRLLDGSGDEVLDLGGCGVGEVGLDGERRIRDVGQQVERQALVADHAEGGEGEGAHEHRDPAPDGEGDQGSHQPARSAGGSSVVVASSSRVSRTDTGWPSRSAR